MSRYENQGGIIHSMRDIIFEDEVSSPVRTTVHDRQSTITTFMMKYSFGLIKTKETALFVQLGIVILGVIYTIYISVWGNSTVLPQPSLELINLPPPAITK